MIYRYICNISVCILIYQIMNFFRVLEFVSNTVSDQVLSQLHPVLRSKLLYSYFVTPD